MMLWLGGQRGMAREVVRAR